MSLALPEQLNFERSIPIDGNCHQQVVVCTPQTGSGTYSPGGYFIINIPRVGGNVVFDPANSFLRFKINNGGIANVGILTLDKSCDDVFNKVEVLYAGNPIETIMNYNVLSAMLLDIQVEQNTRFNALGITKGCQGFYLNQCALQGVGGNPAPADLGAATDIGELLVMTPACITTSRGPTISSNSSKLFSTTLISGICGSLARTYIPVCDLEGQIQLRITFGQVSQYGTFLRNTGAAANTANITFSEIEFHANMIELGPEVMQMVRSDGYTLYSESYSNFQTAFGAAVTVVEQIIPCRYSSLKSLLMSMTQQNAFTNATQNLNPAGRYSMTLLDWAVRIGQKVYPPNRCRMNGTGANGAGMYAIETWEQLKKCFHAGGNSLTPLGSISPISYNLPSDDTLSGCWALGLDLESYSGKSGSILSGENVTNSDLYWSGNFEGIPNASVANFFLHYDMVLKIQDGQLTVHV